MKESSPQRAGEISAFLEPFETAHAPLSETMGRQMQPVVLPEDDLAPGSDYMFGAEVAARFEDVVAPRQVPGYEHMRLRVLQVAHEFVRPGADVLDLGTSRGKMLRDLVASFSPAGSGEADKITDVGYLGVDSEDEMLDHGRADLSDLLSALADISCAPPSIELRKHDLRAGLPEPPSPRGYALVTSVLTVQFVPVEYRQELLTQVYDSLVPGGALVMVEKVLGNCVATTALLAKIHESDKGRNGLSPSAVVNKRDAIEGVLVAHRSQENRHLLVQAGFAAHRIETFWRDLAFEAVVAIR